MGLVPFYFDCLEVTYLYVIWELLVLLSVLTAELAVRSHICLGLTLRFNAYFLNLNFFLFAV